MKKIIIFASIVVCVLSCLFAYHYFKDGEEVNYLVGVKHSQLSSSTLKENDYNILRQYNDYLEFVDDYSVDVDVLEEDFYQHDYLYYVLQFDSCSEEIMGVSNISYDDDRVFVTFDVARDCGVCALTSEVYMIPIEENKVINEVVINYNVVSSKVCEAPIAYKPILYLYPEEEEFISVSLEHPDILLTTYPKYLDGWKMRVYPNGDMYDSDGRYYYALYWDEKLNHDVSFEEGFYVSKDDAISFLEEKLSIIGLSLRERNEFIMYWLPVLEKNEKSIVYFELTHEVEKYNRLFITPKPDSMLRVIMHIKRVDKFTDIKEQQLLSFDRRGFVAVSWGGVVYDY